MTGAEQRAVVVAHSFVSSPGDRLVKEWTESRFPGAAVVNLREEWSAADYDDDVLVVPVGLATDAIGLAEIVVRAPATLGAFRQVYVLGSDGPDSLETFIARSLAGTEERAGKP